MTAASNVKIRSMDLPIIDRVFGMEGGFVLDFSNRTFAEFFHDELRHQHRQFPLGRLRAGARPSAFATTCAKQTAKQHSTR